MCRSPTLVAAHAYALTLVVAAIACTGPRGSVSERFTLELRVANDRGEPVEGARFWADGVELGVSGSAGTLRAVLPGRAGQRIALTIACPSAYRTLTPQRRIALQQLELHVQSTCALIEHLAVVVVRARALVPLAGMPIRSDGDLIGQTDLDGTAHLLLKTRPATSLRIALDTSAWPELLPRDPMQSFELGDDDNLVLVDQGFVLREHAPTPRRAARLAPSTAPRLPYRIR